MHTEGWIFHQDGALINHAHMTRAWIETRSVKVLPWLARSPDIDPTEKLWIIVVRRIYCNERHFTTKDELMETVKTLWASLEDHLLVKMTCQK